VIFFLFEGNKIGKFGGFRGNFPNPSLIQRPDPTRILKIFDSNPSLPCINLPYNSDDSDLKAEANPNETMMTTTLAAAMATTPTDLT